MKPSFPLNDAQKHETMYVPADVITWASGSLSIAFNYASTWFINSNITPIKMAWLGW